MKLQKDNIFVSLGLLIAIMICVVTATTFIVNTNQRIERIEFKVDKLIEKENKSMDNLRNMVKSISLHCCEPSERIGLYDDLYTFLEKRNEEKNDENQKISKKEKEKE